MSGPLDVTMLAGGQVVHAHLTGRRDINPFQAAATLRTLEWASDVVYSQSTSRPRRRWVTIRTTADVSSAQAAQSVNQALGLIPAASDSPGGNNVQELQVEIICDETHWAVADVSGWSASDVERLVSIMLGLIWIVDDSVTYHPSTGQIAFYYKGNLKAEWMATLLEDVTSLAA